MSNRFPVGLADLEMAVIPAGRFMMGSPEDEPGRVPGRIEGPRREIVFSQPFAIGVSAVTVGAYREFARKTRYRSGGIVVRGKDGQWALDPGLTFENPGIVQTVDHPVVGIGWEDAVAFTCWLSIETGRAYRLPSEAEWEYAARAGTTTAFWWGNTIGSHDANCDHRYGFGGREPGNSFIGGTSHVLAYAPNRWGLYQTSGNVWEWCADDYSTDLAALPNDGRAFTSDEGARPKSLRGGSFLNGPWNLRCANRLGDPPDFRHVSFGFRLACSL